MPSPSSLFPFLDTHPILTSTPALSENRENIWIVTHRITILFRYAIDRWAGQLGHRWGMTSFCPISPGPIHRSLIKDRPLRLQSSSGPNMEASETSAPTWLRITRQEWPVLASWPSAPASTGPRKCPVDGHRCGLGPSPWPGLDI